MDNINQQYKDNMCTETWELIDAPGNWNLIDCVKTSKASERAIPDKMQAAGASTSIRRTYYVTQINDPWINKRACWRKKVKLTVKT